jgi:parallel beta-helix repeat protein
MQAFTRLYLRQGAILLMVLMGLLCLNASAATKFYGSYEINDSTTIPCNNKNILTGECKCVGAGTPAYNFRLINDAAGAGIIGGGNALICSPGTADTSSEFAGAYLIDDTLVCRTPNSLTGGCSCPVNTSTLALRTLLDGANGIGGAQLRVCMRISSTPEAFGGAYQVDDGVPGGIGCRAANPDTGACSCPANFSAQPMRAVVDGSKGFIGSHIYTCVPSDTTVQLCTVNNQPVMADTSGVTSASAAIQSCIDQTASGGTYELPVGKYLITSQIVLSKPITLRTQGTASSTVTCQGGVSCATLFADPNFYSSNGMLTFGIFSAPVNGVTIDHIILDGNRAGRLNSSAYAACTSNTNYYGFNANGAGDSFTLQYSVSTNALCGTAFGYAGNSAVIKNNVFSKNGDNSIIGAWSDGLTIGRTTGSTIINNQAIDNSDVGIIIGGAKNSTIQNNQVVQTNMRTFAGLMLNTMGGHAADSGNFTGSTISGNTINCAANKCHIAFNIGDHAWDPSSTQAPILGGTVANNTIVGGVLGLNIDGAGTAAAPMVLSGNTVGDKLSPSTPAVSCGAHQPGTIVPSRFNVALDAFVSSDKASHTQQNVHYCNGS